MEEPDAGRMKILVVDNYDSFTFNLTALVREAGWDCDVVKNDAVDFGRAGEYGKILLSPGPGVPAESGLLCELVRRFSAGKSILGICLGHQAIAEVFGGRLVRLPRPEHGVTRRVRVLDRSESLFDGLPEEFDAGLYHSWAVSAEDFPRCLKITAATGDGAVMALAHREHDVKGVQFHPESVMTRSGAGIIRSWLME